MEWRNNLWLEKKEQHKGGPTTQQEMGHFHISQPLNIQDYQLIQKSQLEDSIPAHKHDIPATFKQN